MDKPVARSCVTWTYVSWFSHGCESVKRHLVRLLRPEMTRYGVLRWRLLRWMVLLESVLRTEHAARAAWFGLRLPLQHAVIL